MNNNYKMIEQMGYKVDYCDDITSIKIKDKNNDDLKCVYTNKTNELEQAYVTFIDNNNGREIIIHENGVIKIRLNENTLISAYNEYAINDVYCDYETNDVFFIGLNKDNKANFSLRIDLRKYSQGYNSVKVSLYRRFKSGDFQAYNGNLAIRLYQDGARVFIANLTDPLYSLSKEECTTENYDIIIMKHINNILNNGKFDLAEDNSLLEAVSIVKPAMDLFIDELLVNWKENIGGKQSNK